MINVPEQKKAQVIRNTVPLITPKMKYFDRIQIIRAFAGMSEPVNEEDIAVALLAIDPDMGSSQRIRDG